jgi:DNA ligase 1
MEWNTLYKRNSDGSVQEWSIYVMPSRVHADCEIVTVYGKLGGKMQTATVAVTEGKNIGKSNETTPYEQAIAESHALWLGKKKKGYVESLDDAKAGTTDSIIAGGIEPMLAHSFDKHGHKVGYPCMVQPKLDGIRCIAVVKGGKATLWTRTRKPITAVPHIIDAIEALSLPDCVLDGELYNHELHDDFEQIVSLVRSKEPKPEAAALVQYHIYDCTGKAEGSFDQRYGFICRSIIEDSGVLHIVRAQWAGHEGEVRSFRKRFADEGYEGVMVRNPFSPYKHGRSYDLLKLKEFEDAEFTIVGVESGKGKMAGAAIFVCEAANGSFFRVKMEGAIDELKRIYTLRTQYFNKKLTVRYQSLTTAGVPRFPIGVAVRDYE